MLDAWEHAATAAVVERVERDGGDAGARGRRAGALTFAGKLGRVDLAVRDWARTDAAVAERLRRVDEARMAYLRRLLGGRGLDPLEVEARALVAFSVALAEQLVGTGHGPHDRRAVVERITQGLFGP